MICMTAQNKIFCLLKDNIVPENTFRTHLLRYEGSTDVLGHDWWLKFRRRLWKLMSLLRVEQWPTGCACVHACFACSPYDDDAMDDELDEV